MELSRVTTLDEQTMLEAPSKQTELQKMKFLATALLVVAFIIFIIAKIFEEQAMWVGFVRATAEAAMVGALADWFAITALFRHPLGLKIPHTAIIPNRKESIGRNLGRFVKNNFLSRDVIAERLQSMEATKRAAQWISQPENSGLLADHIAEGLVAAIQVMKDEDIQAMIEQNVAARIRSTQFAPLLGSLLSLLISGTRKQELLLGTVKLGGQLLEDNKKLIKEKISQETPWWLPQSIDHKIYQKIVDAVDTTLQEVNSDPNHPLHKNFDAAVDRLVEDLKESPEIVAKEEALKEELLQHTVVREFSSSLWLDVKTSLIKNAPDSNSDIRKSIQRGLVRFGETILNDKALLEKIDLWMEEVTLYLIERYGHEVEHLIAHTINRWDAEATSRKIELQVGKDLQFIRINGTVVGGLAGFIIHAFSLLF